MDKYLWITTDEFKTKFPDSVALSDQEITNAIELVCGEINDLCNGKIGPEMDKITDTFTEPDGTIRDVLYIKDEITRAVYIAAKARIDNGVQYVQQDTSGGFGDISVSYNPGDTWQFEMPRAVFNILENVGLYGQTTLGASPVGCSPCSTNFGYDPFGSGFMTRLEATQIFAKILGDDTAEKIFTFRDGVDNNQEKTLIGLNETNFKTLLERLGFNLKDAKYRGYFQATGDRYDANKLKTEYDNLPGITLSSPDGTTKTYLKGTSTHFNPGDQLRITDADGVKEFTFNADGTFTQDASSSATTGGSSKIGYFSDWNEYENDVNTRLDGKGYVLSFIASADTVPTSVLKTPVKAGMGVFVGLAKAVGKGAEQSDVVWTQDISQLEVNRLESAVNFISELIGFQFGLIAFPISANVDGQNTGTALSFILPTGLKAGTKYYVEMYNNADGALMNFVDQTTEAPAYFTNTPGSQINWKLGTGHLAMPFTATVQSGILLLSVQGTQQMPSFDIKLRSLSEDLGNKKTVDQRLTDLESGGGSGGGSTHPAPEIYPNYNALKTAYTNANYGDIFVWGLKDSSNVPALFSLPQGLDSSHQLIFMTKKTNQGSVGTEDERLAQDSIIAPNLEIIEAILGDKGYAQNSDLQYAFQEIATLQQTQQTPARYFRDMSAFNAVLSTLPKGGRVSAIVTDPRGAIVIQDPNNNPPIVWKDNHVAYVLGWRGGNDGAGNIVPDKYVVIPLIDLKSSPQETGNSIIDKILLADIQKTNDLKHRLGIGLTSYTVPAGRPVNKADLVSTVLGGGKISYTVHGGTHIEVVQSPILFKYSTFQTEGNNAFTNDALTSAYVQVDNNQNTQTAIVSTATGSLIQQVSTPISQTMQAQLKHDITYNGVLYRAGETVTITRDHIAPGEAPFTVSHDALRITFRHQAPDPTQTTTYSLRLTANGWEFVDNSNPANIIPVPKTVPQGGSISAIVKPKPTLQGGTGITVANNQISLDSATQQKLALAGKHNTVVGGSNVSISVATNPSGGTQYTINSTGSSGGSTASDPQTATNTQHIATNTASIGSLQSGLRALTTGQDTNTQQITAIGGGINAIVQQAQQNAADIGKLKLTTPTTGVVDLKSKTAVIAGTQVGNTAKVYSVTWDTTAWTGVEHEFATMQVGTFELIPQMPALAASPPNDVMSLIATTQFYESGVEHKKWVKLWQKPSGGFGSNVTGHNISYKWSKTATELKLTISAFDMSFLDNYLKQEHLLFDKIIFVKFK